MIGSEALSPEKRRQILAGAATVFMADGYEGASMSHIARQANVSKGTLYNYFESKADLFRAYLAQACETLLSHVFERAAPDAPMQQRLAVIGRRMVCMMLTPERRSLYRMVISQAEAFPELARAFYEFGPEQVMRFMAEWIVAEAEAGRLRAPDPDLAAEQFFALCQARLWMRYRLHLQQEPTDAEVTQVVDGAVDVFLARYHP